MVVHSASKSEAGLSSCAEEVFIGRVMEGLKDLTGPPSPFDAIVRAKTLPEGFPDCGRDGPFRNREGEVSLEVPLKTGRTR